VNPQSVAQFDEDLDKAEDDNQELDNLARLEKSQKEVVAEIDSKRKTTEKRIEDFDIGKMLGSKF
tara:strand:+ start:320 stop:514 length:195 start_codon:yes stop_codon:yes gene_type:complete